MWYMHRLATEVSAQVMDDHIQSVFQAAMNSNNSEEVKNYKELSRQLQSVEKQLEQAAHAGKTHDQVLPLLQEKLLIQNELQEATRAVTKSLSTAVNPVQVMPQQPQAPQYQPPMQQPQMAQMPQGSW